MFRIFLKAFFTVLLVYTVFFAGLYFWLSNSPRKISKDGFVFKYIVSFLGGTHVDYDEISVFIPKKAAYIELTGKNVKTENKQLSSTTQNISADVDLKRLFIGKVYINNIIAQKTKVIYKKAEDEVKLSKSNVFDYRKRANSIIDLLFLRRSQFEINNVFFKEITVSQESKNRDFFIKNINARKLNKSGITSFVADVDLVFENEEMNFKITNYKDRNKITTIQTDFINFDIRLIGEFTGVEFADKNQKNIDAGFSTTIDNNGFIKDANFTITKIGSSIKNISFFLESEFVKQKNEKDKIKINLLSNNIDVKDLIYFWPNNYAPFYKKLIQQNLKDFLAQKLEITLITEPKNLQSDSYLQKQIIDNLEIKMPFKNTKLQLGKGINLENSNGIVYLKEGKINIVVEDGKIKNSNLLNSTAIIFEDEKDGKFYIKLDLNLVGPIADLFLLLEEDKKNPINKRILSYEKLTSGTAKALISSYFSIEDETIDIKNSKANIQLDNLLIENFIGNNNVSSNNLHISSEALNAELKGSITLGEIVSDVFFKRTFDEKVQDAYLKNKFFYELSLSSKTNNVQIYNFLNNLNFDVVQIEAVKDLFLENIIGNSELEIKAFDKKNLRKVVGTLNLTDSKLDYPLINLYKDLGIPLKIIFSIDKRTLSKGFYEYSISDLKIINPDTIAKIYGSLKISNFSKKNQKNSGWFKIDNVKIGKNDFSLSYQEDYKKSTMNLKGNFLDLSKLPDVIRKFKTLKPKSFNEVDYEVNLKNLLLANNIIFSDVNGYISCLTQDCVETKINMKTGKDKFLDIEYEKEKFFLFSNAATEVIRGFDISNNIEAKTISIVGLKPKKNHESIVGEIEIKDIKLIKSPIMGKLISLTSFKGLDATLKGKGLEFDKIVSDFTYKNKIIEIKRLKFMGGPFGLTAYGKVDIGNNKIDISGAITPVIGFNNFIGKIPLVGGLITGGEGEGLVATQYSIKGTLANPKISVYPLSNLTPGILRRIWQ